ncbi:MAG: hypothetical protein KGI59_01505 [Patescibacteria group bacterium]|nr:hypothetical protein [Patescibacteria group bacterium]
MIERYSDPELTEIWSDREKWNRCERVERAVIVARARLGRIPEDIPRRIDECWSAQPISPERIAQIESQTHQDLIAFLKERKEALNDEHLARYVHDQEMTSYDTQEPAFNEALKLSCSLIVTYIGGLLGTMEAFIKDHRFVPLLEPSHGQGAEVQSLSRLCFTWYQDLRGALASLENAMGVLRYSKLSGMIGSNSGMDPELEETALGLLGLKPLYGSTQIVSRVHYTQISDGLANVVSAIEKASYDIWLGAQSCSRTWREPFGKSQKSSSANPAKMNPILCEQNKGLGTLVRGNAATLKNLIVTARARDISQSSAERVLWPDTFHATARCIGNLRKVIGGLVIFPDNMLTQIIQSKGTYAASRAKTALLTMGETYGFTADDAYNIVQLASAIAFLPDAWAKNLRSVLPASLDEAETMFELVRGLEARIISVSPSIEDIIARAMLSRTDMLEYTAEQVLRWRDILQQIFASEANRLAWRNVFRLSNIMKNETAQFEAVLGQKFFGE